MFDHQHYVPILPWKLGERNAVRLLAHDDKRRMTPLLEISARRPPPKEEAPQAQHPKAKGNWLDEMAHTIRDTWGPYFPVFVEVQPGRKGQFQALGIANRAERLFRTARSLDLKLVPVVRRTYGPMRQGAIKRIVSVDRRGVCIRLTRSDLVRPTLVTDLERLLSNVGLSPEQADLVLDLHVVDEKGFDLVLICAQVPFLSRWRSFTVAGGAFPPGVAKYNDGPNLVTRSEWCTWTAQIKRGLPRIPTFGDYATQNPVPFDPDVHPTPCANIRYTTDRRWLVMKGKQLASKKQEPTEPSPFSQYPAMAALLEGMKDEQKQPYYQGPGYSKGDEYLHKMAEKYRNGTGSGRGNTGNPQTWLTAAVNHHLTYVVLQIAKLFASSNDRERAPAASSTVQLPQGARKALLSVSQAGPAPHQAAPKG